MPRFVSFHWNPDDANAGNEVRRLTERLRGTVPRHAAAKWTVAAEGSVFGARVLTIPDAGSSSVALLPDDSGVILGQLFIRDSADGAIARTALSQQEASQLLRSKGHELIRRYWGQYLAILVDHAERSVRLLRGPMSSFPCYLATWNGVHIAFSDLWDYEDLRLPAASINWNYVRAHLLYQSLNTHETAREGINELRPGECIAIGKDVTRQFYWNPCAIADELPIEAVAEATSAVEVTTRQCVHACVRGHESLLHYLSGGLDSSIVAACLKTAPERPRITCINEFSTGSNTDERLYAREVATHLGLELVERERPARLDLTPLRSIHPRAPYPTFYIGYVERQGSEAALARTYRATGSMSGAGGDQIFYLAGASHTIGDFVRRRGIRTALFRMAMDVGRLEGKSVWTVLIGGLAEGMRLRRQWQPYRDIAKWRRFVAATVLDGAPDSGYGMHPWFKSERNAPLGKLFHAFTLTAIPYYYNPMPTPNDPEYLFPLFAQPIVEVCLRIPTYLLSQGGWDRAIARRAFASQLPARIIRRRTKGGLEEHSRTMLLQNLGVFREMLLDGVLAREQLVDRARLEEYFSLRPTNFGSTAELFEHISTEAWLRGTVSAAQRAAA